LVEGQTPPFSKAPRPGLAATRAGQRAKNPRFARIGETAPLPKALLKGGENRPWRCLNDPWLLAGELHGLLVDQAHLPFATTLEAHLEREHRPWLERLWPVPLSTDPVADHPARVTALRVPRQQQRIMSGDAEGHVFVWDLAPGRRFPTDFRVKCHWAYL